MENREAARALFGVASLLESQGVNPFRVRAYRRAAVNLLRLPDQATGLVREEPQDVACTPDQTNRRPKRTKALSGPVLDVPWLGDRLQRKLAELVTQGKMQFHQDLIAELPKPLRELLAVPGVGPKTANRLINELDVRSPRGLLHHARRGHLQRLRGFGPTREAQLATAAEQLLAPKALPAPTQPPAPTALPQRPIQLPLPEAA